jgi:hypothetical protein
MGETGQNLENKDYDNNSFYQTNNIKASQKEVHIKDNVKQCQKR